MANIFQKIFLSGQECQLIDIINNSKNIKTFGKHDAGGHEASITYWVHHGGMNVTITAKHRWHYAQGDLYTLDISHAGIPQSVVDQYSHENYNISEKMARRIFIRMQQKYIKQTQR